MDRAILVVDLGFGDAGKGAVTDALARRLGAGAVPVTVLRRTPPD